MQVNIHQLPANSNTGQESLFSMQQRNMWQITLEIFSVTLTVLWMVQHGVDVVEDIPFSHFGIVSGLELGERPISDVLAAVGAVFSIGIKWEAS